MMVFKFIIFDFKMWCEVFFVGYFGFIGVGVVFVVMLVWVEFELESLVLLIKFFDFGLFYYDLIRVVWFIVVFFVVVFIIVYGFLIVVFILGKYINMFSIIMFYI